MIRKNLIKCKLFKVKKSGRLLFQEHMASFCPEAEQCPCCKAKGKCRILGYYERYLIDYVGRRPAVERVRVMRLICASCSATHAVLFDPVVPYEQHSLFFILRALAESFCHFKTVEGICEAYGISKSTFYRWRRLYESHRKEWQGLLRSAESSLKDSILEVARKEPFSSFANGFFRQTGISFMQSHKNPAHCRRRPGSEEDSFP